MNLYLVRHGAALSKGEAGVGSDAERPLAPAGIKTITELGARWKSRHVRADRILVSPARRAMQTGEILATSLGAPIEVTDALAIGREPSAFVDLLERHGSVRTLIAVGHHPQLTDIATALAFGQAFSGLSLQPGGVCWVDLPDFPKSLAGVVRGLWNPDGEPEQGR
jgi:phosphohistidine phosphatase